MLREQAMATPQSERQRTARAGRTFDPRLVRGRPSRSTAAATASRASTDEVSDGADAQIRTLDDACRRRQRDGGVAGGDRGAGGVDRRSAEQLVSSVNEMARRSSRSSANTAEPGGVDRRDRGVRSRRTRPRSSGVATAQDMATSAQQVTASIDADGRLDQDGQPRHRVARPRRSTRRRRRSRRCRASIEGVAGNADDLAAAAEETSSSINEMAASIEEVGAMTESLATRGRAELDLDRADGALGPERGAERPAHHRGGRDAAASATELERSIQSVAALARQADEVTRRVARDAEEGGAAIQRSIQGIGRLRESMVQSATVMREMGKRTGEIRLDRRHHQPDRRAHQPAVAQRLDRGGARRRCRPRLRRGRRGDPQPRRPLGQGDRRHRRDHQGAAGGRAGCGERVERRAARRRREQRCWPRPARPGCKKILDAASPRRPRSSARSPRATEEQRDGRRQSWSGGRRDHRAGAPDCRPRPPSRPAAAAAIVQATAQMRKIAQEVSKAVGEQGRASRDIIKAAQATHASGRAGPQGDRRAGGERVGDRPGGRIDAEGRCGDDACAGSAEHIRRGNRQDGGHARPPGRRRDQGHDRAGRRGLGYRPSRRMRCAGEPMKPPKD